MYSTYLPHHASQLHRASALWRIHPSSLPSGVWPPYRTLEFLLFSLDSYKWKEMTSLRRLLRFTSLIEIDALSVLHNFLIIFLEIFNKFSL